MNELPECSECGQPMRPYRTTEENFPNTQCRATQTTCSPCYQTVYRAKHPIQPTREDIDQCHAGLAEYLHQRRQRLAHSGQRTRTNA